MLVLTCIAHAQHNAGYKGKILMIASNQATSKQTGWPIGVWYSELTHPYWTFTEAGYKVDVASLNGGALFFDSFSDPEDASGYAAFDVLSLGFKKDPAKRDWLANSKKLADINPNDYKAIFVCGGQGPMYTFYKNPELLAFFSNFYQTGKPTAAICHGTCLLLDARLPDGNLIVKGKHWTGFANSEENYADAYVGMKIQPFRIEDEARKLPDTHFETAHAFDAFALRSGNLITGQQQNSGAKAAELVVQALEEDAKRYPTYIFVHGAWADESAWSGIRTSLAEHANVVTVNLPAHGIDPMAGTDVNLNDYVKTVTKAIDAAPGKVILVGHSMAGVIVSAAADQRADKVEKVVYVAAYLPKSGQSIAAINDDFFGKKPIPIFEYSANGALVSIRKDAIADVVCADCPASIKEMLVKYHRAEPTKGFTEPTSLSAGFARVPKYYIFTENDHAIPLALQQKMVKADGTVRKTASMKTSHLPFVVQGPEFLSILKSFETL